MTEPLTYRILRERLVAEELVPGHDITITVDQVLLEDATATMAAMQFEMLDVDEVAVPLCIIYTDHNVLQIDDKMTSRPGTWHRTAQSGWRCGRTSRRVLATCSSASTPSSPCG